MAGMIFQAAPLKSETDDTISLVRDFSVTTQNTSPLIDAQASSDVFFVNAWRKTPLKFLGQREATIRPSFLRTTPGEATRPAVAMWPQSTDQ
jgi:hypothetical protein